MMKKSSEIATNSFLCSSRSGGNQVDGLPPVVHTGAVEASWDGAGSATIGTLEALHQENIEKAGYPVFPLFTRDQLLSAE